MSLGEEVLAGMTEEEIDFMKDRCGCAKNETLSWFHYCREEGYKSVTNLGYGSFCISGVLDVIVVFDSIGIDFEAFSPLDGASCVEFVDLVLAGTFSSNFSAGSL